MMINKEQSHSIHSLSIQVSLDGLSFFIQNTTSGAVASFKEISFRESINDTTLLPQVEELFLTNESLSQSFAKVSVIYANDLFTMVPKELFDPSKAADYLKFNTKILSTDFIAHDRLELHDLVTVFVPYSSVNNFFFDTFGSFDSYHSNTVFIKYLLENQTHIEAARVIVHLTGTHFYLGIAKQKKLLFSNRFEMRTKEDFLYHLLFTLEQLDLSTETTPVTLTGGIKKEDPMYEIAYKYIRDLSILENLSSDIPNQHFLLATLV